MLFAILLFALASQEVIGLRTGESAGPATLAGIPPSTYDCVSGRLLDGTNAAPIVGADIELWTEGDGPPPRRIVRDTSRADGSFRFSRDGTWADKILIRAAGYRSTLVASSDASEVFLLPQSKHLDLHVVDLDGKPIAGAHAETRQTCAHAPPAFVGVSNAAGLFDLSTFPPLEDGPEIVVSARGYGAVLLQMPELMLAPGGLEVRLPKRRSIGLTIVDSQGNALANRGVSLGVEPQWIALVTDNAGRAVFESPFFGREVLLKIENDGKSEFLASGRAPVSFEPRLMFIPHDVNRTVASSDPASPVPVHVVDAANRALDFPVAAVRENGSTRHGLSGVRWLGKDWGRTTIIAGGPFSGWTESVRVLDAPVETTLQVAREPVLEIQLPANEYWLVHVQAGDDSITLENPELPLRQPVPAGKVIVVCAVSEKETRLAHLGHIDEDCALDMTRSSSVVSPTHEMAPKIMHRVLAPGIELSGHVRLAQGQIDLEASTAALEFGVPANENFEGVVSAKDRIPRAIGAWDAAEISIALPRRASLAVHGNLKTIFAGGLFGERDNLAEDSNGGAEQLFGGGFMVSDLAPGPLIVDLVREDGGVISISLVLGDGEQRELTLR